MPCCARLVVTCAALVALWGFAASAEVAEPASTERVGKIRLPETGNGDGGVSVENEVFSFNYSFPAEAGRIPALRAILVREMDNIRASFSDDAQAAKADAEEGEYSYLPYSMSVEWGVAAELPDWLSLSSVFWTYTGGAHGNWFHQSMLWDKQAGEVRSPLDVFFTPLALESVVKSDMCDALDLARAEKRGVQVVRDAGLFDDCIEVAATKIVLESSDGRKFDRLTFLIPPYAAGPYAEGDYEVSLPVTEAIIRIVKPEFRDAFAVGM